MASSPPLPTTRSLAGSARAAAARGEPLVVMTSLAGCIYCDMVRNQHLQPMLRDGLVHAIQLDIQDRTGLILDFAGQQSSPFELAHRWEARIAPRSCSSVPTDRNWPSAWRGWACPIFTA
ncbi:MAG: hypothetical protein PHQ87_12355, partial [Hydrogenophaga sp.]|nr:hypothetical protein [Hydrogenophaga sp.]